MTLQEAERIANATVPRRLRPNARICHQGDPTPGLIFLLCGPAEIVKETPHTGNQIVAGVDCECYILARAQYQRLPESQSLATYKLVVSIAALLARNLTAMNDRIIAAPRQSSSPPEHLRTAVSGPEGLTSTQPAAGSAQD